MFRTLLLIGASAMALASTGAEALTFVYTGAVQHYTVGATGIYNVVAAGAHGASYYYADGGQGIAIGAHVSLSAGTLLDIIVGGGGGSYGGGGGGSFILAGTASPARPRRSSSAAVAVVAVSTRRVRPRQRARTERMAAGVPAGPAAQVAMVGKAALVAS